MAQSAVLPPLVHNQWFPMTFDEFMDWSPENGQSEWVDGRGIIYMSNSIRHGQVLEFLALLLGSYLQLFDHGQMFTSTILMRLLERPSARMPDIMIILTTSRDRIEKKWILGPADFALEILSDDSGVRDLDQKRREYETAGVPEYLVVDGREGQFTFLWHRLGSNGRYALIEPDAAGRYHSSIVPGFWLKPDWLKQDPLPNVFALLRLIAPDALNRAAAGGGGA